MAGAIPGNRRRHGERLRSPRLKARPAEGACQEWSREHRKREEQKAACEGIGCRAGFRPRKYPRPGHFVVICGRPHGPAEMCSECSCLKFASCGTLLFTLAGAKGPHILAHLATFPLTIPLPASTPLRTGRAALHRLAWWKKLQSGTRNRQRAEEEARTPCANARKGANATGERLAWREARTPCANAQESERHARTPIQISSCLIKGRTP